MNKINDSDIRVASLSRFKNKKLLGNKKADVCICGLKNYGFSEKVKCEGCGRICFYTSESLDMKKKNIKKICIHCALGSYRKNLNKQAIELLEKIYPNLHKNIEDVE